MTPQYRHLHRDDIDPEAADRITGLTSNYLDWVVLDESHDRVVSSHITARAAQEMAFTLNRGRSTL